MRKNPSNLDQDQPHDIVGLPEVVVGRKKRRRRPVAEIGQVSKSGGSRASPCGVVTDLIVMKL